MQRVRRTRTAYAAVALLGAVIPVSVAGCSAQNASGGSQVSIAGFSVMQTANSAVFKDFQQTKAGKGVTFKTSYGASGDESRAVASGLKVDEVHLSLEPDVTRLVSSGIVPKNWKSGPDKGVISQSVVVICVRTGNPKHITGWNDLLKPGVKVVTPNPGSSGSAKWNILAAYGQVLAKGGTPGQATGYLTKFFKNVVAMPGSGHDATAAFKAGTGDVLLSYENEAIEARQAGADFDYFVPKQTLLIQNPGALTKTASAKAKSFLAFQRGKVGQTDYARQGFRPLDPSIKVKVRGANDPSNPFPEPARLLTIDRNFGGWKAADKKYFGDSDGIVTKILAKSGKS